MSEISIPRGEREALKALDRSELHRLIGRAMEEERSGALHPLGLERCGPYVSNTLRKFETALADHRKAKAAKKRVETGSDARRIGSDLESAVWQMQARLETEEKDEQLFVIEGPIVHPRTLAEGMSIRVSFRWRQAVEKEWSHGSITVTHEVDGRRAYPPTSTHKRSAAERERERQDELYRIWKHLLDLTLCSVRDHFRAGRDGCEIPSTFRAIPDNHSRGLNNFSVDFWRKRL